MKEEVFSGSDFVRVGQGAATGQSRAIQSSARPLGPRGSADKAADPAVPLLRVAAFTGGKTSPSARFRVRQYISPLSEQGIAIDESWPSLGAYPPRSRALRPAWLLGTLAQRIPDLLRAQHANLVLIQREMVSTVPTLESMTRRPRILDIDDSIHLHRGGWAARRLGALADLVIVGNSWLAEIWRKWNRTVEILPTAVDTDRYPMSSFGENRTIGWIGSAENLKYLIGIAPALAKVLHYFPDARIAVCCNRPPPQLNLPIRYIPWSEDIEAEFLASIAIGIMPLTDGPWERGKCSFKMLQYMSTGRPCVVSPIGMNTELLAQAELGLLARSLEEWTHALCGLLADRAAAERMGAAGRAVAMRYGVTALAPRLATLLRGLV